MERYDVMIHVFPNIGEYSNNSVYPRPLNREEFNALSDFVCVNYHKKNVSYEECLKDIKDKMKKIKKILEEESND